MERNVAHLPGFGQDEPAPDRDPYRGETPTGRTFSAPRLTASDARAVARTVAAAAREAREERSLTEVVRAISRTAVSLADRNTEGGREAVSLLGEELGWTPELAAETLEGMAEGWTEAALSSLVETELGEPGFLEGFREDPRAAGGAGAGPEPPHPAGADAVVRRRRALGPPLVAVVHAGNVPGVAVTAALRGLLVRSGVLSKVPSGEPGLLGLFARSLARKDPLLGRCLATTWWPRSATPEPVERAWVNRAGKVVLYGGDEAVRAYRGRLPPEAELLVYGPRLGLAVLLPDAEVRLATRELARDVFAYEQGGCVSPRVLYAVGRRAGDVAPAVAEALSVEAARRPPPSLTAAQATALRTLRAEAEFGAYGGEAGRPTGEQLYASEDGLDWTVLAGGDPEPRSEGLPRVVRVHGVEDLGALAARLEPLEGRIQAVGYAGEQGAGELAERAARLGVARVAPLGRMAWPPADWRHDGRHQLLPLLRWTDWET